MDHRHQATTTSRELPMARSMCWHCQSEVTGEYLCGQCVKVQPLSKDLDYFACFQLPRLLNIDEQELEKTFYELSRTFHPDFYSTKDESEKAISLGNSAFLNAAYRTLQDPIQRAEYLIRLEAGAVKDIRSNPPADLFEEVLDLQENLETFRQLAPNGASSDLEALREKLQDKRERLEKRQAKMEESLQSKFKEWDQLQERTLLPGEAREEKNTVLRGMQEILSNRTYVRNMVNDLLETTG
ncbi:MAG: Fe-S protein assembly co-chaperone HscB [Nitrospirota bacterium]|nr:Fe-S protein assembly co-chaperone HscB [Nitrospirota bacterium]MDH5699803.1 Fe-S protein assembly co-chaperone HscB [Nitrospirota bacterium]